MIAILLLSYVVFGVGNIAWHHDIIEEKSRYETGDYKFGLWLLHFFLWPLVLVWDVTKITKTQCLNAIKEYKKIKKSKENILALQAKKLETEIKILEENGEL